MKRKHWMTIGIVAAVLIFYIAIAVFAGNGQLSPDTRQIDQMAQYLNEKYGYSVTKEDCTYFREADYSWHKGLIKGTKYDVPNIAIFEFDGKTVVTTERNGFYGDDGQLKELDDLLCGYFRELTGLDITYVDFAEFIDWPKNEILHHDYNGLLNENTIHNYMDAAWQKYTRLHLIFYFTAEENLDQQVDEITRGLAALRSQESLSGMTFYITDMEKLNVQYMEPWVFGQSEDRNAYEISEEYVWGSYHVVNDVENLYPARENHRFYNVAFNSFVRGGSWQNKGDCGFKNWETEMVNDFAVADLSDAALEGYLQEMVSYGQYRGYTVLFKAGDDKRFPKLTIKEGNYKWEFIWETGPVELYAFKHGKLRTLEDVYDTGRLGIAEMDAILERHKEHRVASRDNG